MVGFSATTFGIVMNCLLVEPAESVVRSMSCLCSGWGNTLCYPFRHQFIVSDNFQSNAQFRVTIFEMHISYVPQCKTHAPQDRPLYSLFVVVQTFISAQGSVMMPVPHPQSHVGLPSTSLNGRVDTKQGTSARIIEWGIFMREDPQISLLPCTSYYWFILSPAWSKSTGAMCLTDNGRRPKSSQWRSFSIPLRSHKKGEESAPSKTSNSPTANDCANSHCHISSLDYSYYTI